MLQDCRRLHETTDRRVYHQVYNSSTNQSIKNRHASLRGRNVSQLCVPTRNETSEGLEEGNYCWLQVRVSLESSSNRQPKLLSIANRLQIEFSFRLEMQLPKAASLCEFDRLRACVPVGLSARRTDRRRKDGQAGGLQDAQPDLPVSE